MLTSLIGIFFIIIGCDMLLSFIKNRKDSFMKDEADRYLFKYNKMPKGWRSQGRVYTEGIALIENRKTKQKKFIRQAELCDIGLLA